MFLDVYRPVSHEKPVPNQSSLQNYDIIVKYVYITAFCFYSFKVKISNTIIVDRFGWFPESLFNSLTMFSVNPGSFLPHVLQGYKDRLGAYSSSCTSPHIFQPFLSPCPQSLDLQTFSVVPLGSHLHEMYKVRFLKILKSNKTTLELSVIICNLEKLHW